MASIVWVNKEGAQTLELGEIPNDELGPKAKGLTGIPQAWTLPYLVVSNQISDEFQDADPAEIESLVDKWAVSIRAGLRTLGIDDDALVILRSNASDESLRDRGSLTSRVTKCDSLEADLQPLLADLTTIAPNKKIGLIVQAFAQPVVRGHLSNERRLRKEARDGVIQFENVSTGELTDLGIGFRKWRQGSPIQEEALRCQAENDIRAVLHEPLKHAASQQLRIHFEWVWDGQTVYVVQSDIDPDIQSGHRPIDLVGKPTDDLDVSDLEVFRPAAEKDRPSASKLDNHLRFEAAGFWQPRFYLLDDKDELRQIEDGKVSDRLRADLERLTESFLVIRTSALAGRVPLLPRSDLLASAEDAIQWLTTDFLSDLKSSGTRPDQVMLICHRYVQAVGSAFSMARADRQDVLIEAAWGIPEGLYYYPCDTYQVNTLTASAEGLTDDHSRFTMRTIRKGPKRYQVFPDPDTGRFTRYDVARPFDWRVTIGEQDTLNLMAAYSRQLAHELGYPINLMWFIDCKTPDGVQVAIPWYAEKLVQPKISKYRRNSKDTFKVVRTESDLLALEEWVKTDDPRLTGGRPVIELYPTDNRALRDTEFAKRVGAAAVKCDGTVILNGATLSHIYYVLEESGAKVCSLSETGIAPEREFHKKLVRDKIPDVVRSSGESARFGSLSDAQKQEALRIKLVEEAFEVRDATSSELLGELADVVEVVRAIAKVSDLSISEIEDERERKAAKRGSFDDGIMLFETSSGPVQEPSLDDRRQNDMVPNEISQPGSLRTPMENIDHGWRDVRKGSDYWEVIETASVPLAKRDWKLESKGGDVPPVSAETTRLTWTILGKREGPSLRLKLRIQLGDRQLMLDLDDAE